MRWQRLLGTSEGWLGVQKQLWLSNACVMLVASQVLTLPHKQMGQGWTISHTRQCHAPHKTSRKEGGKEDVQDYVIALPKHAYVC